MNRNKIYWLVYTVLIGMTPFFSKLLIFLSMNNPNIGMILDISDFASLGLVICVSIINELSRIESSNDNWKIVSIGIVIIFIVFYGMLFVLSFLSEQINQEINATNLKIMAIIFVVTNFLLGWIVFDRIKKAGYNDIV